MYTRWARFVSFSFALLFPRQKRLTSCLRVFDVCFDVRFGLWLWERTNYIRAWRANYESLYRLVFVCVPYRMTFFKFKRRSPSPSPGSVSFVHQPVRGLLACPPSASQDDPDFSARLFFIMGLCKRLPKFRATRQFADSLAG